MLCTISLDIFLCEFGFRLLYRIRRIRSMVTIKCDDLISFFFLVHPPNNVVVIVTITKFTPSHHQHQRCYIQPVLDLTWSPTTMDIRIFGMFLNWSPLNRHDRLDGIRHSERLAHLLMMSRLQIGDDLDHSVRATEIGNKSNSNI